MLKLQLSPILLGTRVTLGPAPWFRFERNVVSQGPFEGAVAELQNHQWNAHGRHFVQLHADGEACVRFAAQPDDLDASPAYGPYKDVHWADGAMYADGRLLARYDDAAGAWICVQTGEPWPVMRVEARDAR